MLIELEDLSKSFRSAEVSVATQLSWGSGDYRHLALVGPSGSGKSTLLRILCGLERPDAGQVFVNGRDPTLARKTGAIFMISQDPALLPWLTVRENIEITSRASATLSGLPTDTTLERVGLVGQDAKMPDELSGGMKQRVALARALTLSPELLLLDEPFGSIDELSREGLQDLLVTTAARADMGTLLVTHDPTEAVFVSEVVLVLSQPPTTVLTTLAMDTPWPRTTAARRSSAFSSDVARVREAAIIARGEKSQQANTCT